MTFKNAYLQKVYDDVCARNPGEKEFLQAVGEVLESLEPVVEKRPDIVEAGIIDRIVEPERQIIFRVPWVDDSGKVRVNRGFRVQFNSAIGPYKGGLRLHPSVNASVIKFLGFEQIFKNSLTGLPMGGGKGGSDFDPKGKSDAEVMRFCQSFMTELSKHIGADTDVPAGDIGVGAREIGFMFGQYKRLRNEFTGVLTGKGLSYGGSLARTQATGYGLCYFTDEMLKCMKNESFAGKTVVISGSGNVAIYANEKATTLGAKVVAVSDHTAAFYCADGLDVHDMLDYAAGNGRVLQGYKADGVTEIEKEDLLYTDADFLIPAALEGQITADNADKVKAKYIVEGANGPTSYEADQILNAKGKIVVPDILANAGGVIVSYFEWVQNLQSLSWSLEEVNNKLADILLKAFDEVYGLTEERGYPMRTSAYIIALRRLVKTKKIRGIFP